MLRVIAEIWPSGHEEHTVTIGEIRAANISNLAVYSNYKVEISQFGDEREGVEAFARAFEELLHQRAKGAWELVRKITAQRRICENDPGVGLAVVVELATEVLGSPHAAIEWVNRPETGLSGRRPIDQIDTKEGVDQVVTFLRQIDFGIHA